MTTLFIFAMCAFPTTFEDLWRFAAFCGIVLIITTCVIVWRKRSLKHPGSTILIGATLAGSIWSFVLADITSRNYLICAGVPGASADLIRQSEESAHTLLVFQAVVAATAMLTLLLVLISVLVLYFTTNNR
ncbi:MAG TPA: hypothetical protein VN729_13190 [Ktedonobacteraceae bacterium]|nr:hypothetical protein [Ktedonobacteraceae bacterium]